MLSCSTLGALMDWTLEFKEESQCVLKPFSPTRVPHV